MAALASTSGQAQTAAQAFRGELENVRELGDGLLVLLEGWDAAGNGSAAGVYRSAPAAQRVAADVHGMRKGLKRLRALNLLLRGQRSVSSRRECAERLRDAGRELAEFRRATALSGCLGRLAEEHALSEDSRLEAERVVSQMHQSSRASLPCAVRRALFLLEDLVEPPEPTAEQLHDAFVRQARRVGKARDASEREPTDDALHELRKRVKAYRTQLKLVAPDAEILGPLTQWAELLGQVHDLADLGAILEQMSIAETEPQGPPAGGNNLATARSRTRARLVAAAREIGSGLELRTAPIDSIG